jgi:hypothetical protein
MVDKKQTNPLATTAILFIGGLIVLFFVSLFTEQLGIPDFEISTIILLIILGFGLSIIYRLFVASSRQEPFGTEDFVLIMISIALLFGILYFFRDQLLTGNFSIYRSAVEAVGQPVAQFLGGGA